MTKQRIAPVHPGVYLKELLNELKISHTDIFYDYLRNGLSPNFNGMSTSHWLVTFPYGKTLFRQRK